MTKIEPLTRFNWETVAKLSVSEDQQKLLPSNLFSIAQSRFEDSEPYAILHDNEPVGFLLVVIFAGIPWITRLMIDQFYQGNGYSQTALQKAIDMLKLRSGCTEIRTSVAINNPNAEHVFFQAGFRRTPNTDDKEIVMTLEW